MAYRFNPLTGNLDYYQADTTNSPGGSDTQLQFNDGGSFGGDAGLVYNKTTNVLTVDGGLTVATNKFFVSPSTSRVGINENSPDASLHIVGSDATANGTDAAILIENTATGGAPWYWRVGATGTNTPAGGISLGNNSNYWFSISADGKVGIRTVTPDNELTVIGNYNLADADTETKGYRFRTSGSNLDFDAAGADMFISVFSGAGYTGTQRYKFRMESGAEILKIIGQIQSVPSPFGTTHHIIDGTTNGDAVFNEDGQSDADFRVEGDTDTHLLFGDASTDRVGIGTNAPAHKLDIADNTANYSFRIINSNADGFGQYIYVNNTDNDKFGLAVESLTGTILNVRNDGRVGIATNAPNEALEVVGTVRADGLRLDVSPTAETPTMTHTFTISLNGTNYKIPVVAA